MKIAILGSGAGGQATAADFALHGWEVAVFDFPEFSKQTEGIAEKGGVELTGQIKGLGKVSYAGDDMGRVMKGADLIMLVGPAYSTEAFAKACRDYLRPGQTVVVCPSSCGGGLLFKKTAGLPVEDDEVVVAETSTLPYAARLEEPGLVHVFLKLKGGLFVAAIPKEKTEQVYSLLKDVYPGIETADSLWLTMMQNNNPVIHPAVTLLNAALIERTGGDFYFYEDGVTPVVGRLIEAVDEEKIQVGEKLGVTILPDTEIGVKQGYMDLASYEQGYQKAPGFMGIKAQSSLDHRYLNEDVGYGLVFYRDIAEKAGVKTPAIDAVITIASLIMKKDYRGEKARTLETLGLGDKTIEELKTLF